jgi:hypothetical protein
MLVYQRVWVNIDLQDGQLRLHGTLILPTQLTVKLRHVEHLSAVV